MAYRKHHRRSEERRERSRVHVPGHYRHVHGRRVRVAGYSRRK